MAMQHPRSGYRRFGIVVAIGSLVFSACGGGSDDADDPTTTGAGGSPTTADVDLAEQCPLDALASASGPVAITYWHAMTRENETTLKELTDEFNASQSAVSVKLVNQQGYRDNLNKFKAVAASDDAPDLIQLEDIALQIVADSGATVPAAACAAADGYDLGDLVPRVVNYYTVNGALQPMPFNVSNPVFYYNKDAFEKAGLDPEQPPKTFEEVATAAEAIQKSGFDFGFSYKRDSWVLEQFLALNGEPYVNNDNGRTERATEVLFDSPTAQSILGQIVDMVKTAKTASTNPNDGPSAFDNLIAICKGTSAMTIDTSAALGTAYAVLASGDCDVPVDVGVAPLPGGDGSGGVLVGGAANYLAKKDGSPEKLAAAWEFAKFLASPESQATWAAGTGYIPVSQGATDLPAIQEVWKSKPGYKVAYEQLINGETNTATAGPVLGAYVEVRDSIDSALDAILVSDGTVEDALGRAKQEADEAIAAYNDQIGE
jgi:sn-glycerol 3-phosphate transport system substrate-binding protein